MAWIRRNQPQQNTIPELQEYYNAERRERSGLSWLLALVSVACAALVLIGLTFGGKWLYNKLANKMDKDKLSTAQTENQPATPAETATTAPSESTGEATTPAPASSSTPAASTPAPTPAASSTTTTPTPTPTATPAPAVASNTPSTTAAASSSPLPQSGPADTLAIFATTVVLATFVRLALFKRKNS